MAAVYPNMLFVLINDEWINRQPSRQLRNHRPPLSRERLLVGCHNRHHHMASSRESMLHTESKKGYRCLISPQVYHLYAILAARVSIDGSSHSSHSTRSVRFYMAGIDAAYAPSPLFTRDDGTESYPHTYRRRLAKFRFLSTQAFIISMVQAAMQYGS